MTRFCDGPRVTHLLRGTVGTICALGGVHTLHAAPTDVRGTLSENASSGTRLAMDLLFPLGKECHVRDQLRMLIKNARRSGDRIDVDSAPQGDAPIGADVVRLARLATSIHLAASARRLVASDASSDRAITMREPAA